MPGTVPGVCKWAFLFSMWPTSGPFIKLLLFLLSPSYLFLTNQKPLLEFPALPITCRLLYFTVSVTHHMFSFRCFFYMWLFSFNSFQIHLCTGNFVWSRCDLKPISWITICHIRATGTTPKQEGQFEEEQLGRSSGGHSCLWQQCNSPVFTT